MMSTSEVFSYFSIGITVFMAVVLLFGFFLGLIRGWRKSTLRLGIFVGVSVILLLCMPAILNVTTANITIEGQPLTEFVAALVEQGMPATSEVMVGAISASMAIALAALSTVIYLVLFIAIQFITWIIFGICKLFLRKYKHAPKHRFVGGLIGIVQALFVCFVFMIPVAGFADIMNKVGNTVEAVVTEVYAEDETPADENANYQITFVDGSMSYDDENGYQEEVVEQGSLETALNNIAPLKAFKQAYRKSMPGFIYGVGGLDVKTFDYMSVATVDGVKYRFVDEVDTLLGFVDEVVKEFDIAKLVGFEKQEDLVAYLKETTKTEDGVEITNLDRLVSLMLDKLLDSNLVKSVAVEAINALSQSTEDVINALPEAERIKLGFGTQAEVSIPRVSVDRVNWKTEKEKLSNILSETIFTVLDLTTSENNENPESSNQISISNLPLEKLGAVIDKFKTLDLFKDLFNPGLKRLLCVEKLIGEQTNSEGNDGSEGYYEETTETNKITIAEYVKNMTRDTLGGDGFDLANLGDYGKINFENLLGTVKTTLEVAENMNGNGLQIGDLSKVLNGLNDLTPELKAELNKTLHTVIEEKLGEVEISEGTTIADLIPSDLNIIECAPIIGSVMDVATAVGSIGDNTIVDDTVIETLVESINNIADCYDNLTEENQTAVNELVANAVNAVLENVEGNTKQFEAEGIVEDLAKDAAIVDCLLKTNFGDEETEKPNGEQIATAIANSGLVADLLVEFGAKEIFEVPTTEEAAVKKALGNDFDKYESLFNFVAPATPAE